MTTRPLRDCIRRQQGLEIGVPAQLRSQRDPIFDMIPSGAENAVEIGTLQGWFAYRLLGQCPAIHLTCVDPWEDDDKLYHSGTHNRECWEINLAKFIAEGRVDAIQARSEEASNQYAGRPLLDFLFIDGDHTAQGVYRDLELWAPVVKPGGLIAGHDWTGDWGSQVQEGVNRYRSRYAVTEALRHGQVYCFTGNKQSSAETWWWYRRHPE